MAEIQPRKLPTFTSTVDIGDVVRIDGRADLEGIVSGVTFTPQLSKVEVTDAEGAQRSVQPWRLLIVKTAAEAGYFPRALPLQDDTTEENYPRLPTCK